MSVDASFNAKMKTAESSTQLLQMSFNRVIMELSMVRKQYENQLRVNDGLKEDIKKIRKDKNDAMISVRQLCSSKLHLELEGKRLRDKLESTEKQLKRKIDQLGKVRYGSEKKKSNEQTDTAHSMMLQRQRHIGTNFAGMLQSTEVVQGPIKTQPMVSMNELSYRVRDSSNAKDEVLDKQESTYVSNPMPEMVFQNPLYWQFYNQSMSHAQLVNQQELVEKQLKLPTDIDVNDHKIDSYLSKGMRLKNPLQGSKLDQHRGLHLYPYTEITKEGDPEKEVSLLQQRLKKTTNERDSLKTCL